MKRALGYFAIWLVLLGNITLADAIVGVLVALAAARLSLFLGPASRPGLRFGMLAALILRLLRDSLVAGVDVARRALTPAMPLRTGFVAFPTKSAPGDDRSRFTALTSVVPGSVPTGSEATASETMASGATGPILFHCLDTSQPVAEQLAGYEARLARALGSAGQSGGVA